MTQILHLVAHDLRSQRLVLLAFCLFVLVDAWLVSVPVPSPLLSARLALVLNGLRILMLVLATGVIVQQDALVGSTAFWRSRPISRATLLASKSLTLLTALVAFPGFVTWLVWVWMGLYAGDAALVAASVMLEHAVVILLTAMAAVVTPSLTYLIVAGVAGGTMVSVINGVLLPALLTSWPFVGQSLQGYRPALYLGTLFALGVPAVAYQYLRMKEWHTAAFVAVALLAATVVTRFWPAAAPVSFPPVDPRVVNPQAVSLTALPGPVNRSVQFSRSDSVTRQDVVYGIGLVADGQPPGVLLWRDSVESRLLLRDRTVPWTTTEHQLLVPPAVTPATHPLFLALNAALWPARLPDPDPRSPFGPRTFTTLVTLPLGVDEVYAGQRALLTADVNILATRSRVSGTAPAVAGARVRRPGSVVEVLSASTDGRSISMRVRTARLERPFAGQDYRVWRGVAGRFLLRNLKRRQAFDMSERVARVASGPKRGFGIGGMQAGLFLMDMEFRAPEGEDSVALDAAWLADAELVTVDDVALGTFTRPIQLELVLGEKLGPGESSERSPALGQSRNAAQNLLVRRGVVSRM